MDTILHASNTSTCMHRPGLSPGFTHTHYARQNYFGSLKRPGPAQSRGPHDPDSCASSPLRRTDVDTSRRVCKRVCGRLSTFSFFPSLLSFPTLVLILYDKRRNPPHRSSMSRLIRRRSPPDASCHPTTPSISRVLPIAPSGSPWAVNMCQF
jgi:hypothetical protein